MENFYQSLAGLAKIQKFQLNIFGFNFRPNNELKILSQVLTEIIYVKYLELGLGLLGFLGQSAV